MRKYRVCPKAALLNSTYCHIKYIELIALHLIIQLSPINLLEWSWQQKNQLLTAKTPLLHMLYYMTWLTDDFWTRTGDRSLIAPMALAHPLHPIDNRSRNRRRNLWVGWCVFSWWPLFPSRSSVLIYIYYIYIYICSSIWVVFSFVYQLCLLSDDK